jgi:hypothetical protein
VADKLGTASVDPSAWAPATPDAPLSVIWSLLGRPIAFHRRLVDLTDNVKAALLLSQSIYWTRRGRDIAEKGGWFHKTTEQWAWETGLSPKEQSNARDALKVLALVDERRMGLPARLHFRVNMERLASRLAERIAVYPRSANWENMAMVAEMLGPSVTYHRALVDIAGGVHAGLMLSRALYLTRLQHRRQHDGWICNSAARWSEEIGLTRREQETARRDLARAGVWEEALRGMPPSLAGRVRLDRLLSLLTDRASQATLQAAQAGQVCVGTAVSVAQKGESSLWHSHILVSPKPPSLFHPKRHHCFDESAIPLIQQEITSVLLQPPQDSTREAKAPVQPSGGGGGDDLIFPDRMLPEERAAARLLLRQSGEQAQVLLDELAGRLQANGVRSSPVAYLRGLITRVAAGSFVAELATRIASERRQHQKAADERCAREAEERRQEAERATPEYQARIRTQREKISRLLVDMKRRMGQGPPR